MAFNDTDINFAANATLLSTSAALVKIPALATLLGVANVIRPRQFLGCADVVAVLAWGRKPSAIKAEQLAQRHNLPLLRLEDGFLRSVGLGADCPPFSVVLDDQGIYYDARSVSRLESLILQPLNDAQQQRARQLVVSWRKARVSKYNHSREQAAPAEPYVLVVDQTFGDASIEYGLASAASFQQMLQSALERYPQHKIVLKIHPDVFAGKKRGHFSPEQLQHPRIMVLTEDIHAPALLEHAAAVFCVTSQMGFEALLWQKPVYTFGMPFYAGWGLTADIVAVPPRRKAATIEQLVYAALIAYARYIHPETNNRCEVEALLAWLELQRRQRERFATDLYLGRVPRWKKPMLRQFFQGSRLHFNTPAATLAESNNCVAWGWQRPATAAVMVEDGFIRSVGLGADLTRPASWVQDPVGMYYDATAPSALELLLLNYEFDSALLARAEQLQQSLIALNVTKYNVGQSNWQRPAGRRVILVPGQVESDASIQRGSPQLKTNQALLEAVRTAMPEAYIIYKPHPDVLAGLRKAGSADVNSTGLFDELVTDQDMAYLLCQVDEVHTLCSLTGFEALLRGITVYCYGQPFYAGWGLTIDRHPPIRRQRKRTITELIAASLILYPTYISQRTGYFTTPERVIYELKLQRELSKGTLPWWRPLLRQLLALKRF